MAMMLALLMATTPVQPVASAHRPEAQFSATVTIVRDSAEVGHGREAPPWAHPRWTRLQDAAGAARPAQIYDFE